jgi:hypothetical protein
MTLRKRPSAVAAGVVVAAATLGLGGAATQASAAGPGPVPPGTTVCTGQIRADAGVVLSGSVTRNTSGALWTVLAAGSAGGPDSEVLRTPTGPVTYQLNATSVVPPVAGTWFFRGCARTTGPLRTSVQIQLSPI